MKKIYTKLVFAAFGLLLFSCKPAREITVSGTPGTDIYKPDMSKVATIQESGNVSIKLNKKEFLSYMMSKAPGSSDFVPFALDYEYKNYRKDAVIYTGAYAIGFGTVFTAVGLGLSYMPMTIVGIPTLIAGSTLLGVGLNSTPQTEYNFKYLQDQNINNDVTFVDYLDKGVKKEIRGSNKLMSFNEGNADTGNALSAALSNFKKSSTETKTYGQLVAGTYIGTGKIILDGKQVGLLENMRILIDNVDGKSVSVDVQDSKGEPCLGTKNLYDVKSPDGNTYTMSLIGNSDAVIRIDSNGSMEYIHPKVEVDGNIFTLDIKASKK